MSAGAGVLDEVERPRATDGEETAGSGSRRGPGKRREFEREALPHLDAVYAFALRQTGSPSDAEDLVQETYLRAYRSWDRYTPGTRCKSWLFTICRNLFVRSRRRRRRRLELLEERSSAGDRDPERRTAICFGSRPKDPERTSLGHIVNGALVEALNDLPEIYRESVRLKLLEELDYDEVADRIDVPVGTVKSRVHRGRQILRRRLRDYAP